jgi:hypothetical protein
VLRRTGRLEPPMPLERTQQAWEREIRAAKDVALAHTETLEREEYAVCGLSYGDADKRGVPDEPENHRQTWLRQFHAQNTLGSPECILETWGAEWPIERAVPIEMACNRAAYQIGLKETLHRAASDYALRRAVLSCYVAPQPGYEGEDDAPWMVGADRLASDEYLHAADALARREAAWEGHHIARPIEDVIHEAEQQPDLGWDLEALRALEKQVSEDKRRQQRTGHRLIERSDLVYWRIWERSARVDKAKGPKGGYHGSVHYVLDELMPTERVKRPIRKSEPWFGHRDGPYAVGGALYVGSLPWPVSPLVGTGPQADWTNIVAKALMLAVANYKAVTGTTDSNAAEQLRDAINGDVVEFANSVDIRTLAATITAGGLDQQFIVAFQLALESLQRNAGTYQNRQGSVDSEATATAILDAQAGYASAMEFWADGFRDLQRQVFARWAYWFDLHPKVRIKVGPLPEEARAAMSQQSGQDVPPFVELRGGMDTGSKWTARDHDLLDLRVHPFSGRAKNEQGMLQDVQFLMGGVQWLAGLGPLALAIDTGKWMRMLGRARGIRDAERLLDPKLFAGILAMSMGQQEAPQAKPPQTRPTLALGPLGGGTAGSRPTPGPGAQPVSKQLGPARQPSSGASAPRPAAKRPMAGAAR